MERVRNRLSQFRPQLLNPVSLSLRKPPHGPDRAVVFEITRVGAPTGIPPVARTPRAIDKWRKVSRFDRPCIPPPSMCRKAIRIMT